MNLDSLEIDDLRDFWKENQTGDYVRGQLASYALNKAAAIKNRKEGRIVNALNYEKICDRIYGELPVYARW